MPAEQRRLLEGRAPRASAAFVWQRAGDVARRATRSRMASACCTLLGPSRDLALVQQNFGSFCNRIGDFAMAQAELAAAAAPTIAWLAIAAAWRTRRSSSATSICGSAMSTPAGEALERARQAARYVGATAYGAVDRRPRSVNGTAPAGASARPSQSVDEALHWPQKPASASCWCWRSWFAPSWPSCRKTYRGARAARARAGRGAAPRFRRLSG